jgi:cellulose synthase/poly-beta-1,6-N-acetylglucosamine synthase-like glycosyltransferase
MTDIEIPLGKRTPLYRFFEMIPALVSYGAVLLLVVLSLVNPLLAAVYLLIVIITTIIKAIGIAYHTIAGRDKLVRAQKVDWHERLQQLETPTKHLDQHAGQRREYAYKEHLANLHDVAAQPELYPKPSQIFNAVIVPTYNESYEVIQPTMESLVKATYAKDQLIVVLTYEERAGKEIAATAKRLQAEYEGKFKAFILTSHPADTPDEVVGKGPNITHAGRVLQQWLDKQHIKYNDVIVTTMDADNKPYPSYFDYVAYEYIVHLDRKNLSYQPICLFFSNIWDVPAPMRVVATGNSFWNIISSMRPHTLRNFASHSQPMDALVEMDFWSVRTVVEDGHQYWRSYFHFDGNYAVLPLYVPIYQDAVLSSTYLRTLKAQFIQLRRWAYGASDVAYVANLTFNKRRKAPFWASLARLIRLLDSHITLSCVAVLITFGGWIPLLVNNQAAHSIAAHQLPEVISHIQQFAMVGLFITILLAVRMLPPRPARYKRRRTIGMVLQWLLMPIISLAYSSASAYTAQTALLLGRYFDKFDVTEKVAVEDVNDAYKSHN